MPSPTHRVPPMVRATVGGTTLYAYLLEWVGDEMVRIGWAEQYQTRPGVGEPYQWRWAVTDVPRGDMELLEGQSYTAVPTGAEGAREPEREEDTRTWRQMKRG